MTGKDKTMADGPERDAALAGEYVLGVLPLVGPPRRASLPTPPLPRWSCAGSVISKASMPSSSR